MPISRMSVTSDADLELRLLPSTGVIRLRRYYEPLRHPKRPGLSLTGVRLGSHFPPLGFPVLQQLPLCRHAVVNTPVARWALIARGTAYSNRFPTQRLRPSPFSCKVGVHIGRFQACSTFTGYYGLSARCIA